MIAQVHATGLSHNNTVLFNLFKSCQNNPISKINVTITNKISKCCEPFRVPDLIYKANYLSNIYMAYLSMACVLNPVHEYFKVFMVSKVVASRFITSLSFDLHMINSYCSLKGVNLVLIMGKLDYAPHIAIF